MVKRAASADLSLHLGSKGEGTPVLFHVDVDHTVPFAIAREEQRLLTRGVGGVPLSVYRLHRFHMVSSQGWGETAGVKKARKLMHGEYLNR
jgi:hypothetical protein